MLRWALAIFIFAIAAGILGFTSIAAALAGIAQLLFWGAVAVLLIVLVLHVVKDTPR